MISEKMQEALNEQVNKEFYSAYMYLAMSAYCETLGLPGFAHWMRMQYEEESSVNDVVAPLRMLDGDKGGLMMIDQKLAMRQVPAALVANN